DGQEAISNYKVIDEINNNSLVEFLLETGRTHQIRVTCNYLGHPILGDSIYGNDNLDTLHLYSYYLSFVHPYTNELIEIIDKNISWLK
nr:hypothetical protein [Acholeplasmatales bacterium]